MLHPPLLSIQYFPIELLSLWNHRTFEASHWRIFLWPCRYQYAVSVMLRLLPGWRDNAMFARFQHAISEDLHDIPKVHDDVSRHGRYVEPSVFGLFRRVFDCGRRIGNLKTSLPAEKQGDTNIVPVCWNRLAVECFPILGHRVVQEAHKITGTIRELVQGGECA